MLLVALSSLVSASFLVLPPIERITYFGHGYREGRSWEDSDR